MNTQITVNVDEELVYQVRIQAIKEGYELDAMTEMLYENYLYGGIAHNEEDLKRIQESWNSYTKKWANKEIKRLENEWKAKKEKGAKTKAIQTKNKELLSHAEIDNIFKPIA